MPGRRARTRPCLPHRTRRGRRRTSRSLAVPCVLPFQPTELCHLPVCRCWPRSANPPPWEVALCVPKTLHRSPDLLVPVEQAAEPVVPSDGVRVARRRLGDWLEGSGLAEGAVWPVAVVVRGVLGQQGCRVPLVGDEDA